LISFSVVEDTKNKAGRKTIKADKTIQNSIYVNPASFFTGKTGE
jgi:hypothetical protein